MAHPFIPVANTALVEMVFNCKGQIIENTYHVQRSTPFTGGDLQGLTNTFDTWDSAATGGKIMRANDSSLTTIKARALDTSTSPTWINTLVAPRSGARAQAAFPTGITFCVTLQTGRAGRSQRGRIYVPGLSLDSAQAAPNGNLVTALYAGQCVTALNLLITTIAGIGAGYALVVTSLYTGGAWRAAGSNTVITNAAFSDLAMDSQRRRLSGRGH